MLEPKGQAARPASVAYPCLHADRAKRQPTASAGVNGASNVCQASPAKPSRPDAVRSSTTHSPAPVRLVGLLDPLDDVAGRPI